jgi:quercetin dioxygenase-like cupin family protein
MLGHGVTTKVSMAQARGAFSLFELAAPPGDGVPPHVEHRSEEVFYVLEGELRFLVGAESIVARAGDCVCVGRGTVHAWQNAGATLARALVVSSPGGVHEPFFAEVGLPADAPAPAGPPDAAAVAALGAAAARHGIEMLPMLPPAA